MHLHTFAMKKFWKFPVLLDFLQEGAEVRLLRLAWGWRPSARTGDWALQEDHKRPTQQSINRVSTP